MGPKRRSPSVGRTLSAKMGPEGEEKRVSRFTSAPLCGVRVTLRQLFPAAAVLILGTALALALLFISKGWEYSKSSDLFLLEGDRQLRGLEQGVQAFRPDIEAVLSFLQLNPNATWPEFEHFAGQQLAATPGAPLQALVYVPRTLNENRAAFEEHACDLFCEITGRTYDTMFIRNTSGLPEIPKARYFGVFYAYPLETNVNAILFDISSSTDRNITINAAIETGTTQATPRITLVQEGESAGGSYGMLIIRSIFQLLWDAAAESYYIIQEEDFVQGLANGVVRIKDLFDLVADDIGVPSMQAFLLDASNLLCTPCNAMSIALGECPGCELDFLHSVTFDADAVRVDSVGFRTLPDGSNEPWYTAEEISGFVEGSSLTYASKFEVFGRTWLFVMVGVEALWINNITPWLLFGIVVLATVCVALLMVSSARQAAVNAGLQAKAISRLKVITMQQWKDKAIACTSEVLELLKGMSGSCYTDGSNKPHKAVKGHRLVQALETAKSLALVHVSTRHWPKSTESATRRSIQRIFNDLYQECVQKHSGMDVTDAEAEAQAIVSVVFLTAQSAGAFVMELMSQMTEQEWPADILKRSSCKPTFSSEGLLMQRGPRVSACIHWAEDNFSWSLGADGRFQLSGTARVIASEIVNSADECQVLLTKPACDMLLGRTEDAQYVYLRPLGYFALKSSPEVVLLSQIEPSPWDLTCPGVSCTGSIKNLEEVAPAPVSLIAPPGSSSFDDARRSSDSIDSQTGTGCVNVSVSLVLMSCDTLEGAPARVTAKISDLVHALAQTFCGYVVPGTSEKLCLPPVMFLTPTNAVRFSSAMQVALLHTPWDVEDAPFLGKEVVTDNGKAIFRGPRVSMAITHLPPNSIHWRPVGTTRPRREGSRLNARALKQPPKGSSSFNSNSTFHASQLGGAKFDSHRPFISLTDVIKSLTIVGSGLEDGRAVVAVLSPGQVVLTGSAWDYIANKMPDETRPLDLGTFRILNDQPLVQLVEVQVRPLQNRHFLSLPEKIKVTPGYSDAPNPETGIAYLMCKVTEPVDASQASSAAFTEAVSQWNDMVRSILITFGGYECSHSSPGDFSVAFPTLEQGLRFAVTAQWRAMDIGDEDLLRINGCEKVLSDNGDVIFKGMRIKMGLAFGIPQGMRPSPTGRATYMGAFLNTSAACVLVASPGQIIMEGAAVTTADGELTEFQLDEPGRKPIHLEPLGRYKLKGIKVPEMLLSVSHPSLKDRAFSAPPGRVVDGTDAIEASTLARHPEMESSDQQQSMNDSLAGVMQEILADRMAWAKQKYRADEKVDVQGIIGLGSFGKVYSGLWKGVPVAYKVIQYPAGSVGIDDQYKTTAIMETAISASMSHPNVVQTYSYSIQPVTARAAHGGVEEDGMEDWGSTMDWGSEVNKAAGFKRGNQTSDEDAHGKQQETDDDGDRVLMWEVRIIQEFCDRGSMRKVLDDKTFADPENGLLNPTALLKLAGDIARGMLHIHSMQIIHGDLKAHNILVTGANTLCAKVADFGLSVRMEQEQTHVSGVHSGTMTHMAPEILMSGHLSKTADVYAFGIIMFEILTGEKAFKGHAMHQLATDVCVKHLRPTFPLGSPPRYVELAKRCWSHNADDRPTFSGVIDAIDEMSQLHEAGEFASYSSGMPLAALQGTMLPVVGVRNNGVAPQTIAEEPEGIEMSDIEFSGSVVHAVPDEAIAAFLQAGR